MGEVKEWMRDAGVVITCRPYVSGGHADDISQIIASHAPAEVMSADELWEAARFEIARNSAGLCFVAPHQSRYQPNERTMISFLIGNHPTELACRAAAAKWAEERGGGE